ncbi:hypothetical protein [Arthrobacter rhizosphaerae]|uniref:hypothetical protein n=1 Tax=Arthrobacter rhizosphaerae TaxID=2855490 RepID=UPI001FF4A0C5|nr:hypothetical protein [Arthrobacter rhizosphaerae]
MSELPERGRVVCHGFIESVTFVPASDVASFTAVVRDRHTTASKVKGGTSAVPARLRVTWLGRRRVPGIAAGVELQLQGMLTLRDGLPTMFNPRYEILSRQEHE